MMAKNILGSHFLKSCLMSFVFGLVFFAAVVAADLQADVQPCGVAAPLESLPAIQLQSEPISANSMIAEFDKLMEEVIATRGSSEIKRCVKRSFVKIIGYIVGVYVSVSVLYYFSVMHNNNYLLNSGRGVLLLMAFWPVFVNHFIGKSDKLLDVLKNLEKYVSALPAEQLNEIKLLFNEKYADILNDKILNKNGRIAGSSGRIVTLLLDLFFPIFFAGDFGLFKNKEFHCGIFKEQAKDVSFLLNKLTGFNNPTDFDNKLIGLFESHRSMCLICAVIFLATGIPDAIFNFKNNTSAERAHVLEKIQKTLA